MTEAINAQRQLEPTPEDATLSRTGVAAQEPSKDGKVSKPVDKAITQCNYHVLYDVIRTGPARQPEAQLIGSSHL
jgi:hypothetical protein